MKKFAITYYNYTTDSVRVEIIESKTLKSALAQFDALGLWCRVMNTEIF